MAKSHQGTANNNVINLFEKGKDPEEKLWISVLGKAMEDALRGTFLYLLVSVIFYFLHFLWAEYRITQRRSNEIFIDNAGVFSATLILYE